MTRDQVQLVDVIDAAGKHLSIRRARRGMSVPKKVPMAQFWRRLKSWLPDATQIQVVDVTDAASTQRSTMQLAYRVLLGKQVFKLLG